MKNKKRKVKLKETKMGRLGDLAHKFMALSREEREERKKEFIKKAQKIIDSSKAKDRKLEPDRFDRMLSSYKGPDRMAPEKIVSQVVDNIERDRRRVPSKQIPEVLPVVDLVAMEQYHMLEERQLAKLAGCTEYLEKGDITGENPYWFKDNGSDILGVAHLDVVCPDKHFILAPITGETLVFSPSIDNRLGAYAVAHFLPSLGVQCDVLLTTHEERCRSTADLFVPPKGKKYKWIFEFDRKGDDVVMYQFENKKCISRLEKCGFRVGTGSYSDICEMDSLGCKAFNFGCGYEDYHTRRSFFSLEVFKRQVKRFLGFYQRYKNTAMKHDPKDNHDSYSLYGEREISYGNWNEDYIRDRRTRDKTDAEFPDIHMKHKDDRDDQRDTFGEGCVYCGNSRSDIHLFTYRSGYKICAECAREIGWDSESLDNAIKEQDHKTKRLSVEHPALLHGDTYCMDCNSQFFREKTEQIMDAKCPECAGVNICGVV